MKSIQHFITNRAGWHLSLMQTWAPDRLVTGRRPVLIVPGYGMNSFIFSYHPRGTSLEGHLVNAGYEVWRVDLRDQGESVAIDRSREREESYSLEDLAMADLGASIDAVLERTRTGAKKVSVIGASLGGTLMFAHAILNPEHKMASLVAMGSPVRWVKAHPLVKALFVSPMLAGLVRFRGTREMAEVALPLLIRFTPWLISIYMTTQIDDASAAKEMVRTVEDPNRFVNREIARWIKRRDLIMRGVNLSEALKELRLPLLCVLAHGDGIVPRDTAAFPYHQIGSAQKDLVIVGGDRASAAHADLFIGDEVHRHVFDPISRWFASTE